MSHRCSEVIYCLLWRECTKDPPCGFPVAGLSEARLYGYGHVTLDSALAASMEELVAEQERPPKKCRVPEAGPGRGRCAHAPSRALREETCRVETAAYNSPGSRLAMTGSTRTLSLLFADTINFSRLSKPQIERYPTTVLTVIAEILKKHPPLARNTWGDGLFLAYEDPEVAAQCALELKERFLHTAWEERGLPADIGIRIALHCGPVHVGRDPVAGTKALYGHEVNRTARIEPIVVGTQIYATAAFKEVLPSRNPVRYAFDFLGQMSLAKGWSSQRLYALRYADHPRKRLRVSNETPNLAAVMPACAAALKDHSDDLSSVLAFVDRQNLRNNVIRKNWNTALSYDVEESRSTVVERVTWNYVLVNVSNEPIMYPLRLIEGEDMALKEKTVLTLLDPRGRRKRALPSEARPMQGVFVKRSRKLTIPPGHSARCDFEYAQRWQVSSRRPTIHNCLVPPDLVIECTLNVTLPNGFRIGVLVGGEELSGRSQHGGRVFRIPFLAAEQAIEYLVQPIQAKSTE